MARHHAGGGSHDTARPRSGPTGNAARTARVSAVGGVAHVSCVMLTEVLSPGARPPDAPTSRGPLSTQRHRSRSQRAPRAPSVLQLRCSQRQIATPGAARAPRIHRVRSAWAARPAPQCIWSVRAIRSRRACFRGSAGCVSPAIGMASRSGCRPGRRRVLGKARRRRSARGRRRGVRRGVGRGTSASPPRRRRRGLGGGAFRPCSNEVSAAADSPPRRDRPCRAVAAAHGRPARAPALCSRRTPGRSRRR